MKESFLGILKIHKSVNFGAQQIVILYASTVRRKFEPFAFTQDEGITIKEIHPCVWVRSNTLQENKKLT